MNLEATRASTPSVEPSLDYKHSTEGPMQDNECHGTVHIIMPHETVSCFLLLVYVLKIVVPNNLMNINH